MAYTITTRSAKEKAAILLIALGKEASAKVFQQLSDDEIEQLTLEIANIRKIDTKTQGEVVKEFHEAYQAQNYIMDGGIDYALEILNKAIGQQRAYELIGKLTSTLQVRPFDFARRLDPSQLLNIIQHEQPQTIALILSYLDSRQAAPILSALPTDIQAPVIAKIARMGKTSPEHIKEVERVLEKKLSTLGVSDYTKVGGIGIAVDILNAIDRGSERYILESLDAQNHDLADEIKSKMCLIDDIVKLNRGSMQRVLKEVDNDDLVLALKGVKEPVQEFIFENISKRMQEMIKEEMEIKGPVRIRDAEEAQQKIVNIIRRLEEAGEVVIARGQEEQLIG
ncbi:MAG: flagellar motor switch protein FliG [Clostridiaceae bacterium]|nr:flagellar motor switch protein FliG [Clostridiaceae bacterium]